MKMTLKMENTNFELEFNGVEEACEFINVFMRNNPKASVLTLSQKEKRQILDNAANLAAEWLGIDKEDPSFQETIKMAEGVLGL